MPFERRAATEGNQRYTEFRCECDQSRDFVRCFRPDDQVRQLGFEQGQRIGVLFADGEACRDASRQKALGCAQKSLVRFRQRLGQSFQPQNAARPRAISCHGFAELHQGRVAGKRRKTPRF